MKKFRKSGQFALLVLLGASFFIGVVLLLKAWKGIPTEQLTRDPNAIFDMPLYVGFLSQVGIFIWAATAMVCLYSSRLIPREARNAETRRYLFMSGLLLALLGLDDAFLLHEQFFPFIGIPEKVVYGIYAGIMFYILLRFSRLILKTKYPLLLAGLVCFALSISLDWLQPESIDIFLVEDGAKLVGILSWLAYFSHTAFAQTANAFVSQKAEENPVPAQIRSRSALHLVSTDTHAVR